MNLSELGHVSSQEYSSILSSFLHQINFKMPTHAYDLSIQKAAMEYFERKSNWPAHIRERAVKVTKPLSVGVAMCYQSAPFETRLAYAIHATYVLFIDDIVPELGDALDEFSQRLVNGQPQKSPILQSLVDYLVEIRPHLGPYANAMNAKSCIEFVSGLILERDYDGKITPPAGALTFPSYFRQVTGFSEPYAHFLFPEPTFPEHKYLSIYFPAIQDLIEFTNYTNDIISFYKESVIGNERLNYICNVANTRGISIIEALQVVCEDVVKNVKSLRKVFEGHQDMLKVVEDYFTAYVTFHLIQPRYKLMGTEVMDLVRDAKGERVGVMNMHALL